MFALEVVATARKDNLKCFTVQYLSKFLLNWYLWKTAWSICSSHFFRSLGLNSGYATELSVALKKKKKKDKAGSRAASHSWGPRAVVGMILIHRSQAPKAKAWAALPGEGPGPPELGTCTALAHVGQLLFLTWAWSQATARRQKSLLMSSHKIILENTGKKVLSGLSANDGCAFRL